MHAVVSVDDLGDGQISCHTAQHVSIIAAEVLGVYQKVNHLADGDARGFMQLRMKAHADVMRGRFRTRIFLARPFVHDELQRTDQ